MIISLEILLGIEIISITLYMIDAYKKQKHLELQKVEIAKMVDTIKLIDKSPYTDDELIEIIKQYKGDF